MHYTIEPSTLTNKELIRFAEELAHTGGMPVSMQLELIRRLLNFVH